MRSYVQSLLSKNSLPLLTGLVVLLLVNIDTSMAQDYLVGSEEGQLQMIVHIVGEVKRPGEYRVGDKTNLLELFSKAGGPTQFSKLSGVTISRVQHGVASNGRSGSGHLSLGNQIIKVNLDKHLKQRNATSPPELKPGDVVFVPRNSWSTWRNVATILRDVGVPIGLYLAYVRANRN